MRLHIDLETYSSTDIKSAGLYKYVESPDFEIMLLAYAFGDDPVKVVDLTEDPIPQTVLRALSNPQIHTYHAHNAAFERLALKRAGITTPASSWSCTMVKAAYCGLPLSLGDVSKALSLGDEGKMSEGKALIKFFCTPCKPTKANGMRTRNLPEHDPEKWALFMKYCARDVYAERRIYTKLSRYKIPESEKKLYALDQKINDRGVLLDMPFVRNAVEFAELYTDEVKAQLSELTGLANPNSTAALKKWIEDETGVLYASLSKDVLPEIAEAHGGKVSEALELKTRLGKSSVAKYDTMLACACNDGRARGLIQFYGANRTGRWAGRLVQVQNLPRNKMKDLDAARNSVLGGCYDTMSLMYDRTAAVLSELIRTAFISPEGRKLIVSDFSAIEARVIAWLASETWRLEVFAGHGKIYEASAAVMFGKALEDVTKEDRQKGKVSELALGYQGGVGALIAMGGDAMGLSEEDMSGIVHKWRAANPRIVRFWHDMNESALAVVKSRGYITTPYKGLSFSCDGHTLQISLPSGRSLFYQEPRVAPNRFGKDGLTYKGMNQTTRKWEDVETYGGKLVENIVQAVARDLLAESLLALDAEGFDLVMHVHDEAVAETEADEADEKLKEAERIMGEPPIWAKGLPLGAVGFTTSYYMKD